MPLLRRAEKFAATVHQIRINRRNIGQIATWAKWNVYNGCMNIVYEKGLLVNLFREIVGAAIRLPQTRSNSVIVNVGEGEESATKPSYTNEANRNYIFHLIFRLFQAGFPCTTDVTSQGSLMVITPYSAQLAAYQNEWDKYIVDDYMRRNVTFKTVHDSMSAEADIVIFDTVRTEKFGFVPVTPRMGVATTRARGGMITILKVAEWSKKGKRANTTFAPVNHVVSFFNRHLDMNAVHDTQFRKKGWTMLCRRCGGPGHFQTDCKSTNQCRNHGCDDIHDSRFCAKGFTCHPDFKLRQNKPKPTSNPSITPGPAPQIEDNRLLPTARRTRAQILAGTIGSTTDAVKTPKADVSEQMRAMYRAFKTTTTEQTVSTTGVKVAGEAAIGQQKQDREDRHDVSDVDWSQDNTQTDLQLANDNPTVTQGEDNLQLFGSWSSLFLGA